VKVWRAVVAGDHRLAVDQERRCLDAERGGNDGRETIGPIMAVAREAADARAIPANHQPVAVVLDFMNPERAGGRPRRLRGLARFDEAGGSLQLLRCPKPEIDQPANGFGAAEFFVLPGDPGVDRRELPVMHPDDHRVTRTRCFGSPGPGFRLFDTTN
jgi:hypothetical protein